MKYQAKAPISGRTAEFIKEAGKIIKCMEKELLNGQMAKAILENTKMIKKFKFYIIIFIKFKLWFC